MSEPIIREYRERDLADLLRMFEKQNLEYRFPDLSNPLFVSKLVLENGRGRPEQAILLRATSEAFLLRDPDGDPREQWAKFQLLHAAAERDAWRQGLEDVHAFLPPEIARRFGKRLEQLGWVNDTQWPCYSKVLVPKEE